MGIDLLYNKVHDIDRKFRIYKKYEQQLLAKAPHAHEDFEFHCAVLLTKLAKLNKDFSNIDMWFSYVVNIKKEEELEKQREIKGNVR